MRLNQSKNMAAKTNCKRLVTKTIKGEKNDRDYTADAEKNYKIYWDKIVN